MVNKDGVGAWVKLGGSFTILVVLGGMERSFGIWYVEILHNLGASSSISTWISGVNTGLRMIFSPLVSALCYRWPLQRIAMIGGLLFGGGVFISAFVENPSILLVTYGVVSGVGASLSYLTSYVSISENFDKYKGVALTLVQCGSGTGSLIFSQAFTHLFTNLSYFESVSIIAGITLHLIPAGALLDSHPAGFIRSSKSKWKDEEYIPLLSSSDEMKTDKNPVSVRNSYQVDVLKAPIPWLNMLAGCVFNWCSFPYAVLIIDFAGDRGVPLEAAAIILTVSGAVEVPARLLAGLILQSDIVYPYAYQAWFFTTILAAIISFVTTQCTLLWHFVTVAAVNTACVGAFFSGGPIIISRYFNEDVFSEAMGIYSMGCGLGSLTGSVLSGALRDVSDSYILSYFAMGADALTAGMLLMIAYCLISRCNKRKQWHLRT